MDSLAFLAELRARPEYANQLAHVESIPPRDATYGELRRPLHPALERSLASGGLLPLYSHQAEAINALWEGEHVVVATPAASGKSLCYQLPIIQTLLEDGAGRALLIYPTKALTQDQLRNLKELLPSEARLHPAIYDGDTPQQERQRVRRSARILLSNPDMLHLGILPNKGAWAPFLQGLRYVVVDEAHVYRGIFGSHVAELLRRLRRLCARYGSRPQFILCSATIANPGELARRLTGLPFREVARDGSPSGGTEFAFWNPPLVKKERGSERRSPTTEASHLFAELIRRGVRTLTFVRTRRMVELVYSSVRELLGQESAALASRIAPYRGSYLPEERRRVEQDLKEGRLLGVTTTNALELGIDIGHLDASVLTGYPGSVASSWQQAGRSGRRGESSLTLLIARDDPLDQYLMRHPDFFFGRPHEEARVAPENPYILAPHLLCAAYESPLTASDEALFGPTFRERVQDLIQQGLLHEDRGRWFLYPSVAYPAQEVNLRATSGRGYTLVEESTGRLLEEGIEESAAFVQLHPGAIYLHRGEPYLVTELDLVARVATLTSTNAQYHTQARELTNTRILQVFREKLSPGGSRLFFGDVEVTSQVVAFKRLTYGNDDSLGEEPVDLPSHHFRTMALWFETPVKALEGILESGQGLAGGLHAVEHAAIGALPLFALCDRNDIGGLSTPLHPDTGRPEVFIHDGYPGGIGIAERGFEIIEELWEATLLTVAECPCQEGCPGCIQSPKCGNNNQPLDKAVAVVILKALLGRQS